MSSFFKAIVCFFSVLSVTSQSGNSSQNNCWNNMQFMFTPADAKSIDAALIQNPFSENPDIWNALPGDFVKTPTGFGFMMARPDLKTRLFAQWAFNSSTKGAIADIGSSFGVATLKILEETSTKQKVIAVDLDAHSLMELRARAKKLDPKFLQRLILHQGKLAGDLEFEKGQLKGIFSSRVLHFLSPEEVRLAFSKMYEWLAPGGRLMITVETPFNGNLQSNGFGKIFSQRVSEGNEWPGLIEDVARYYPSRKGALPALMNFLTPEILEREAKTVGFKTVHSEYIDRAGDFPRDVLFDGRESAVYFGEKPKN